MDIDEQQNLDYLERVTLIEWLSLGEGERQSRLEMYSRLPIQATPIGRHINEIRERILLVTQQTQNMYIVEAITDGLNDITKVLIEGFGDIDKSIQELVNKGD